MIGFQITDPETGKPLEQYTKLTPSAYQPPEEVKKLFARVQMDYQIAWSLQNRPWNEFDGKSLLQRTREDQETFGAYVGAEFLPVHKRWRWKGRKNTARNKIIGILAHMLAAMLFPMVYAQNDEDEEDKMSALVMRILIEEHLRKAKYEMKFLYMVLTALVNPKVWVHIEYVQAIQKVKVTRDTIKEVVDELLSGIQMHILPIDELLLGDFFTPLQQQSVVFRLRRIPYDQAVSENKGMYFLDGKDVTDYIQPGMTKMVMGSEEQTLYDVPWTEADRNYVQELTAYYKGEDLEVKWIGGVGIFDHTNVYNANPFKHRRMTMIGEEWLTMPIYPFAGAYFEPIDPTGRFQYGKSAAFKEFWDDATQNKMHQLMIDGTYLDVIKPMFISGVSQVDSIVIAPGATVGMPAGSQVSPYQMGPNLAAAMKAMEVQKDDMSESTQDKIMNGAVEPGVTATAVNKAEQNARIFLGEFGLMIASLVADIGELVMDCEIQHVTVGDVDASVPEALSMKFKTILAKGKEKGKDVTHRIEFTDKFMGQKMTPKQIDDYEWKLFDKSGGKPETDQYIHHVNPYKFARTRFSMYCDAEQIYLKATGADKQRKIERIQMLTNQFIYPFVDGEAFANSVIEDESDGDPDRFKKKGPAMPMMGAPPAPGAPTVGGIPPLQTKQPTV